VDKKLLEKYQWFKKKREKENNENSKNSENGQKTPKLAKNQEISAKNNQEMAKHLKKKYQKLSFLYPILLIVDWLKK